MGIRIPVLGSTWASNKEMSTRWKCAVGMTRVLGGARSEIEQRMPLLGYSVSVLDAVGGAKEPHLPAEIDHRVEEDVLAWLTEDCLAAHWYSLSSTHDDCNFGQLHLGKVRCSRKVTGRLTSWLTAWYSAVDFSSAG